MKAVQYFSDEHLHQCSEMTTDQILQFLSDFQQLHTRQKTKTKLISIKVPEDLLGAFRTKAELANVPYQTQIKKLMQQWVLTLDSDPVISDPVISSFPSIPKILELQRQANIRLAQ